MKTERDLQVYIFKKIKPVIKSPYGIDMEVPIPYKHIYIPENDSTRLEVWYFKQDIAIYKPMFKNRVAVEGFNLDIGKNYRKWGLPYVIIEIKKKTPITHEILAYCQKAKMIKSMFPYCQYLFLMKSNSAQRVFRLNDAFDEIILLKNINSKQEIKILKNKIQYYLDKANKIIIEMQSIYNR